MSLHLYLPSWMHIIIHSLTNFVGTRRKVIGSTKLPQNFADFLRNSKNKEELFQLLTKVVTTQLTLPDSQELHITDGKEIFY